jgi:hypothetical protein
MRDKTPHSVGRFLPTKSSFPRRRAGIAVGAFAAAAALALPGARANAAVAPLMAGFENAGFAEISQPNTVNGTVNVASDRAYEGSRSVRATYNGGGSNGYARAVQHVAWQEGDDVWYGAAFYLPPGYAASLQGANSILRWDNYGSNAGGGDVGGIEIQSGGQARLKYGSYTSGGTLGSNFRLPEGHWFWLEVHQRLSRSTGAAVNEVRIDGQVVSSSTGANFGRPIDRLRVGEVAIQAGRQTRPLTLYFDRFSIATAQRGPLGAGQPAGAQAGTGNAGAAPAAGAVRPRLVAFGRRNLSELDRVDVKRGRFTLTRARSYEGRRSARASIRASRPGGVARGVLDVSWPIGSEAWYGGAFYLPKRLRAVTADVTLLRWDNSGALGRRADFGAVVVSGSDKRAHLVQGRLAGRATRALASAFDLPTGRWFFLEVRQRFSPAKGQALNQVYVDGKLVSSGDEPNTGSRPADRVRYGLVSVRGRSHAKRLTLWVDRLSVSPTPRGPQR